MQVKSEKINEIVAKIPNQEARKTLYLYFIKNNDSTVARAKVEEIMNGRSDGIDKDMDVLFKILEESLEKYENIIHNEQNKSLANDYNTLLYENNRMKMIIEQQEKEIERLKTKEE